MQHCLAQAGPSVHAAGLAAGVRRRQWACRAAAATAQGPPTTIVKISPERVAAGGLDPLQEPDANRAAFSQMLQHGFLPVNLSHPGVRILNIDPPVLTVDSFLPAATCDALVAAVDASGRLAQSQVGGVGDMPTDIRTSSTLAITRDTLKQSPDLEQPLGQLMTAAAQLIALGADGQQLMARLFTPPSGPSQLCPELPQVARYLPGQHFLAHEDGFPAQVALKKGYQRRATLLVYLNDVPQGGATKFEHLGLAVQPAKGKALLFFPAFSGGMPDARTLHTADDAVDEKWVSQLWLCSGLPQRQVGPQGKQGAAPAGSGTKSRKSKAQEVKDVGTGQRGCHS